MVMNSRSIGGAASAGAGLATASGGSSEGHRKARSTRSCAPGWRCIGTRIAAGGRLNNTPPTVIGSAGASGATIAPGQRGHSTSATNAAASTISATSVTSANISPAEALRFLAVFAGCLASAVIGTPNHREYATQPTPRRDQDVFRVYPLL